MTENTNFKIEYAAIGDGPIMASGGGGFSDLHPWNGQTYGDIVDVETGVAPEGFDNPGAPTLEISIVTKDGDGKGKRVRKTLSMSGKNSKTGEDQILVYYRMLGSIASGLTVCADKAALETAATKFIKKVQTECTDSQSTIAFLKGKRVYYTVQEKLVRGKGGKKDFWTSDLKFFSSKLEYDTAGDARHQPLSPSAMQGTGGGTSVADTLREKGGSKVPPTAPVAPFAGVG